MMTQLVLELAEEMNSDSSSSYSLEEDFDE